MNKFFLDLPPKPQKTTITYDSSIVLFGSCFVENIGQLLEYHKFQNSINPFGIIFHPQAIYRLIERVVLQKEFTEDDLFFHNEQWHCFEVHSQLSSSNKDELLNTLNFLVKENYKHIGNASHFILTYGTAWGYQKNDQVVANCHKVPQKEFQKKLSSITSIEKAVKNTCKLISSINSNIEIIATVSPVRHIKDGIIENNLSKAHLLSALHTVSDTLNNFQYYPSYELVIDCLRDYRFYNSDLIHPNQIAIDFIWEHFSATWLHDSETKATINQITEIQQGSLHRPFNPESEAHKKFLKNLEKKKETLIKKYPFIEF